MKSFTSQLITHDKLGHRFIYKNLIIKNKHEKDVLLQEYCKVISKQIHTMQTMKSDGSISTVELSKIYKFGEQAQHVPTVDEIWRDRQKKKRKSMDEDIFLTHMA